MTAPTYVVASYRKQYTLTSRAVGEARRAIVAFARTCGFTGQGLDDIEIAVGEALANAFEHGSGESGTLDVHVQRDRVAITIDVKDSGRGFELRRDAPHACPPAESLRGFGTFIMRELMDDIEYSERGTRLRLRKKLPAVAEWPALEA